LEGFVRKMLKNLEFLGQFEKVNKKLANPLKFNKFGKNCRKFG
jgi:hypothetical protein